MAETGWPTVLTLGIALVFALLLAFGSPQLATANFPLMLLGVGTTIVAIRQTRRWWLLLFLPLVIWPLLYLLTLTAVCLTTGNCL